MKSRPVYGTLQPRRGERHIIVVDAAGAGAVTDMASKSPPGFFSKANIIHVSDPDASMYVHALKGLCAASFVSFETFDDAKPALAALFDQSVMSTKVYVAGSEGLIGQVQALALAYGFELSEILTEHRGTTARRVQCVHCKSFIENVTTQPVTCTGCGLSLFVRDHYSVRLAAFQGVCIDAEQPGSAPAPEVIFP